MPSPLASAIPALGVSLALVLPGPGGQPAAPRGEPAPPAEHVVAISVDGLNPQAIRRLGRDRAPVLHRLRRQGAGTLNARTERELTITLPNHTGMVTGRRVAAGNGGHGVTWNDERMEPRTVQDAADEEVRSVFTVVHASGGTTGLFASKQKFTLFRRSWPSSVDRTVIRLDNRRLASLARRDLRRHGRDFTFVHLSLPDVVGHRSGFMSADYLRAVARSDRLVGKLLATVRRDDDLRGATTVVLTADHGGRGPHHSDPAALANYRVPFLAWGAGVSRGSDLYDLNPDYADPGRRRPGYAASRPPVRNGDVANLATDLLGLDPVSGSELDAEHDLDVD